MPSRLTHRLATAPAWQFVLYATAVAFTAYLCAYALRKPLTAARFDGEVAGSALALKTVYLLSQLLGYTASKFLGLRVCAELPRHRLAVALAVMAGTAEAGLILFAALPMPLKPLALVLNGLPLGMVWGVLVRYLEGRRTSEVIFAGLTGSYVLAGGFYKDFGRWLTAGGVPEVWMPALTGAIFLPPFALAVALLDRLPPPGPAEVATRSARPPLGADGRRVFLRRFLPGLAGLLLLYVGLTAYRDYRDNYGIEMLDELGGSADAAVFTRMDLTVALAVTAATAALGLVRDHRRALLATFALILVGLALLAGATASLDDGLVGGVAWLTLIGLGSYLAYVPFAAVLFERVVAATRFGGTAVFGVYLADSLGCCGSVVMQLSRDLLVGGETRAEFFRTWTYAMAVGGVAAVVVSGVWLMREVRSDGLRPLPSGDGGPRGR